MSYHNAVETIFGLAIFINALLFLPQIITLIRHRSAEDLSFLTFGGFLVIQLVTFLHGIIRQDWLLSYGMGLSLILCGTVVILIICFKNSSSSKKSQIINPETNVANLSLANLIKQFPGNIYWKDLNGCCLGASEQQAKDLGYNSVSEILGKNEFDFFPIEQAKTMVAADREIITKKITTILREAADKGNGDQAVYISAKTPLYNDSGELVGLIGMSIDITETINEEKNRALLWERMVSLLPGNIYWKDRECRFLGCNLQQAKQLGLATTTDIIGKKTINILPSSKDDFNRVQQAEAIDNVEIEVMRSNQPIAMEETFIEQDGTETILFTQKVPLVNMENEITGLLNVSVDITAQKNNERKSEQAKEEAQAVNRLTQEILYNLRHDIRTPFSGIIGVSQILRNRLESESLHLLDSIESSAEQLLGYLNDILEFSQIETKSIPVLLKPFNFKKLCEDCMLMVNPALKNKGLELIFDYQANLPHGLITDAFRVKRILVNLLSNAAKFTQAGSVALKVEALQRKQKSILVKISVEDTGIGIPEEKYQVIFEKFSRLSSSYNGVHKGLGLGLQAVKNLIEDLEGEIHIDSQIGRGTVFTCFIPMQLQIEDRFESWKNS